MEDSKQVPEVRFKCFGDVWKEKHLGNLGKAKSGIGFPEIFQGGKSGVPFYKVSDMNNHGNEYEMKNANNHVSDTQISLNNWTVFDDSPAVIFAKVGAAIMLNRKRLVENIFLIDNNLMAYIFGDEWDVSFGKVLFDRTDLTSLAQIGALPSYNASDIENYKVTIPADLEQTKIGELFKNLDTLINQHQTRVAQLANVKKSMLDKMFPKAGADVPEARFGGFLERWKSCKFEGTVTFYSGLTYSPNDVQEKPGTLVLRSSNVKRGEIINADNVYVNSEVINCDFVQQGDIVVVVRNGSRSLIGKHAQVKSTIPNTVIGAFMTGIRSKQPSFINALLDTSLFYQEVEKCLGATINQITQGMFKKMHFMIPANENEMALIGNYFQNLDSLIAQNQKSLSQLKNIKQALLHKMFV